MMTVGNNKEHPLPRSGISQRERTIPALDPATLELEDRSLQDRMAFAQKLAEIIRFQRLGDESPAAADANWTAFYENFDFASYPLKLADFDKDFRKFGQAPHGGLFSVYLKLFEHLRADLNRLPKKHLDFYYRQVLQLAPKSAQTDRVHVVFEPALNKGDIRVPQSTTLNAGKQTTYQTSNEIFISQAKIVALHAIFSDPRLTDRLRVAFDAQSLDGLGEPLTDEQPIWKPFGFPELPALETGFAIASPILALHDGARRITVTITLRCTTDAPELPANDDLRSALIVELSGEEAWLGPFTLDSASVMSVGNSDVKIVLGIRIGAEEDPISFYDISKLEGGFDTVSPILKLSLDESADVRISRLFSRSTLRTIKIDVSVSGAKEFDLENDLGRLNPDKPFLPFGPQPVTGSSFYVISEELLSKKVTSFKLRLKWQDAPIDFAKRYSSYGKPVTNNHDFKASMSLVKRGQEERSVTVELFDKDNATQIVELNSIPELHPLIIQSYKKIANYFSNTHQNVKALFPGTARFINLATSPVSRTRKRARLRQKIDLHVRLPNLKTRTFRIRKRMFGVIRVTLQRDFFHREYPYYLAAAIANQSVNIVPQPPYTPTIESIELDYSANAHYDEFGQDDFSSYQKKTVQLFHITPFGHAEQHAFLKSDLSFVSDRSIRLTQHISDAGALIIGVKDLEQGGSLSMLIQVAQGTANPLRERQKVQWSLLVRNHWRPFDLDEMLIDETNQLLSSGIVRLKIPNEAIYDNTLFNPDLAWIRASVVNHADAVCDLRAIHLHAVTADVLTVLDTDSSGSIASGTITKFRTPVASIKSISQPYGSFGGRAAESDQDFYLRTSERLRHKLRAVTAADYERLVLEEFSQLHSVRCLTHTDANSYASPGKVSLIVIPTTAPEARFDRLKPRVDLDTLSKIEDFVNSINTYQITADARNPDYEEVELAFSVRFHSDRPFAPYRTILNEDLIKHLSPWVSDTELMPGFGVRLHKSQIIKFIDDQEYVDFVTNLRLYSVSDSTADLMSIQPSSATAILVSSTQHVIDEAEVRA